METKTDMMEETKQRSLGGLGAELQRAREAMNLSQKDVALRLHLKPTIIQIIENEDLLQAPPPTFMRGYVRSYAKLLNINEEKISRALVHAELDIPPTQIPISRISYKGETIIENGDRYVHWVTMLILSISLILAGIWWTSHPRDNPLSIANKSPTQTEDTSTSVNSEPVVVTTATSASTSITPTPVQPASPAASPSNPTASSGVAPSVSTPPAIANSGSTLTAPAAPSPAPSSPAPTAPFSPYLISPSDVATAEQPAVSPPHEADHIHTAKEDPQPRKKHAHRSQDNHVSGMAMALPEPGL